MANATNNQNADSGKKQSIGDFLGKLYSFNNSLKLYHWHVTGKGSYAEHIALDQALETLGEVLDRIVETSFALYGTLEITIPQTTVPSDVIEHATQFYQTVEQEREMFDQSFSDSIIDDYQEAIQQLIYRLKRLQ